MIIEPKFPHDCIACEFLGHVSGHDLYYCLREPTVVARYGPEGHQYKSGLSLVHTDALLTAAYYRAKIKDLVTPEAADEAREYE